ncbi:hypothetical protein ACFQL3_17665 [Natronoarchaeum sp. GCM10025321]|uniref:hypothetical protein n=1 Tax=Natronoarchaeum sp. GCM10025321 TaxID=3252684 RepID=UPI003609E979
MVTKRALGASLLLLGLAFVGLFHTVAAFAFDSGLEWIGLTLAGLSLLGLVLVNTGADESAEET